ncbi:MAG: hypothetical protein OWQ57_07635 [Sulfobacillus sp.]|nr:hypothetical protein [Sulfobacillus sp.]
MSGLGAILPEEIFSSFYRDEGWLVYPFIPIAQNIAGELEKNQEKILPSLFSRTRIVAIMSQNHERSSWSSNDKKRPADFGDISSQ